MGLPPRVHPYVGGFATYGSPGASRQLGGAAIVGAYRDVGNAVIGLRALGAEAYLAGSDEMTGGLRLLAVSPALFIRAGANLDARSGSTSLIVSLTPPTKRGGFVGRRTQLRIDWLPSGPDAVHVGVTAPLGDGWVRRKPIHRTAVAIPQPPASNRVAGAVDLLRGAAEAARWITSYTGYPTVDGAGNDGSSRGEFAAAIRAWRDSVLRRDAVYPEGRTYAAVITRYHALVDSAFVAAAGGDSAIGLAVASAARETFLDEVLLPYNRLLGQRKKGDALAGLGIRASEAFARRVTDMAALSTTARERSVALLREMVAIADSSRRQMRLVWDDDTRPVWIPLQLALRPSDHDTQVEIDRLVERAVGERFSPGNEMAGASSAWFPVGLMHSISAARDYHLLWLHDFQGKTEDGRVDTVSFGVAVRGYMTTLARRVAEYDSTGRMPSFIIMIDQYFYEVNDGRRWLKVLEDPMADHGTLGLPPALAAELRAAQEALRQATRSSARLQRDAQGPGRGPDWIRRVVRVHVNVTNRPDWTVRSEYGLPGVAIVPDHRMRDHRKIVLYDVSEDDPRRGGMIVTGTGVGEHYTNEAWDDRAVMVRGPVALASKHAAYRALLDQGFGEDEIPPPLRPRPGIASPQRVAAAGGDGRERIRRDAAANGLVDAGAISHVDREAEESAAAIPMLSAHNEVGFAPKQATVAQAMLYTLMPPGSVMYVPDAFWSTTMWAGQLVGAALRGSHVLVISPAKATAPMGKITLARQRELVARLMVVQETLADRFAEGGGEFRVGLYTRRAPVGDIPARLREAVAGYRRYPFLGNAIPFAESLAERLIAVADSLGALATNDRARSAEEDPPATLLHRKTQLLVNRDGLIELSRSLGVPSLAAQAIQTRTDANDEVDAVTHALTEDMRHVRRLVELHSRLDPRVRERAVYYTLFGSMNMDPISVSSNGEVVMLMSGSSSLAAFLDFFQLAGATTWVETSEELEELIPRSPWWVRWIAHRFREIL